jgi:hypothetical protein
MRKKPENRKGSPYILHDAAVPAQIERVHSVVQGLGAEVAFVVGGAMVDAQLNRVKQPRDFDLHLFIAPEDQAQALAILRAQSKLVHEFNSHALVVHLDQGPILDVRFMDRPQTPPQAMRYVDVGISAIVYDLLARKTWVAPEFVKDHARKVISLRAQAKPSRQLEQYLTKLEKKFPDYSRC